MTWHNRVKNGLQGALVVALLLNCFNCGMRWHRQKLGTRWQGKNPNVVLISIDTLRMDHCSVYGYERNTTPNLKVLADQGARFDLAYAPSATTAPSHATMFSALYPISHQVLDNGWVLSEEVYTLAEHLGIHGYQTTAFVSSSVLDKKFGFAQGFTLYDDDFSSSSSTIHQTIREALPEGLDRRADETTRKVIDWLKAGRVAERPFFLFVHYFDPHDPYVPPETIVSELVSKRRYLTKLEKKILLYDGEIFFTDREIGKLLKVLKQLDLEEDTLVVVTSDHGEGLGQHGYMYHSINIYEEQVRVPLLFRYPAGLPKGKTFSTPVELVDLVPTILDLISVPPDGFPFQGQSLAEALHGKAVLGADRPAYLYRKMFNSHCRKGLGGRPIWLAGDKYGIRCGDWKYIEGKAEKTQELFNLAEDSQEMTNLTGRFPEKWVELASHLEDWKKLQIRHKADNGVISEEDLRRLEALGYIVANSHNTNILTSLADADSDKDGVKDYQDNCPCARNPGQEDTYPKGGNGYGDACDCIGNLDRDGEVGVRDVSLFKSNLGRKDCKRDSCKGDFDCDGDVDDEDYLILKENIGRTNCAACELICNYE